MCGQVLAGEHCSITEYVEGEDDLAFCFETDDQNWDAEFLSTVASSSQTIQQSSLDDSEDDDDHWPEPKVQNIRETIGALEDVQYFLQYHGHSCDLSPAIDTLSELHAKTLNIFFNKLMLLVIHTDLV